MLIALILTVIVLLGVIAIIAVFNEWEKTMHVCIGILAVAGAATLIIRLVMAWIEALS